MAKIKIYEYAKQIDKPSKELVEYLNEKGCDIKSHMSSIEDKEIELLDKKYKAAKAEAPKTETAKAEEAPKAAKAEATPASRGASRGAARVGGQVGGTRPASARSVGTATSVKKEVEKAEKAEKKAEKKAAEEAAKAEAAKKAAEEAAKAEAAKKAAEEEAAKAAKAAEAAEAEKKAAEEEKKAAQAPKKQEYVPQEFKIIERPKTDNKKPVDGNNFGRDNRRDDNRQGGFKRDDNRQGGFKKDDNRQGGFGKEDKGLVSSVFNPANSGKNADGSRNSRANWNNKKNDKDRRYDDSKENFDALKKAKPKKGQFIKPEPVKVEEPDDGIRTIVLPEVLTIKELADKIKTPSANLVKKLFLQGKVVTINQEISFEDAEEIALEFNCIAEMEEKVDVIAELLKEDEEDETTMVKRPPVVCVMGHVDHGKTSLLDAIRQTKVTDREAGGITQHIGAYTVRVNDEKITFLDTPGHEAFTSMRMRGANSTDIAILVVAADDGVMPQTVEAINHAKAAGVQIIVAVNKIDKPSANIERVKQELVEHELVAEDWGGDTVFVPVSAHTKEGIDTLLDMIVLTAEMLELKANRNRKARGLVIEAQLDKGRGPVATVLIQKGTLRVGDPITIGSAYGKVRAMINDKGKNVRHASPSTPVEILGLNDVPNSGEILIATENEKEARNYAEAFIRQGREKLTDDTKQKLSLDGLFSQIQAGNIKELNIIVKADVQGSVEAVKQSLLKLSNEEVAIKIIHGGVGAINESDVTLASASNAIIIGFNVRPDNQAKEVADREKVDLRLYKVIYNAIEDVEAAMKGMLDPIFVEKVIAHAEVRQVFKASGVGTIAGSYVLDGKITRGASARITRDGELIHTGPLESLKRFKDDVKEVASGYECGLVFEKFNNLAEFDQIEFYIMEEVPR